MRWICGLVVLFVAAACGGDSGGSSGGDEPLHLRFDGIELHIRTDHFELRSSDGTSLLRSFMGEGAYAPVAVRSNDAEIDMAFGAFLFTEGDAPWQRAASLRPTRDGFEISSDAGVIATATFSSIGEESVELRFSSVGDFNRLSLAFECAADDHFLGFGAQADGVDHRGQKVPIWTSEPGIGKVDSDDPPQPIWFAEGARHASSMGLPTWLSSRGYVGVVDNDRRSVFHLCSDLEEAWRVEVWDGELALQIYNGPAPKDALERATGGRLGRPPAPPPMAFAPWNDAIFGPDEVRRIAQLIRDEDIPSSVIWTEDFRGGDDVPTQGYRLAEEWDLDRSLYPDAEALDAELEAAGFAWFAYFNTFLVEGTGVFEEAEEDGHFILNPEGEPYLFDGVTFEPSGLADLSRPETWDWTKSYLQAALDIGFDGWMADFCEWMPHDAQLHSGEDGLAAHNRYPDDYARLNAEVMADNGGLVGEDGSQRLFFMRSGWLGSTAHTPVYWAGDQRTSFQRDDGMFTVIPIGLNLGLAGVSTYGHDIAGYQSASNPTSTKELFFRWTTLGALSPVMRTHHGLSARENWWFGADEETLAHFRRWAREHIELFPYLDGGSIIAETRGLPLMRALALEFPDDEAVWTLDDQYLLGPSLLVAPVTDEGATSRSVYLPDGRWYPLWEAGGAAPLEGPGTVEVDVPLGEIAWFGRGGTVVPRLPSRIDTLLPAEDGVVDLEDVEGERVLDVFLGRPISGDANSWTFETRGGERYDLDSGRRPLGDGVPSLLVNPDGPLEACPDEIARGCIAELDEAARRAVIRWPENVDPNATLYVGDAPTSEPSSILSFRDVPGRLDIRLRW